MMKRIFTSIIVAFAFVSASAQVACIYKDGAIVANYSPEEVDSVVMKRVMPKGHEAVDLGSSNGVLWATCNVGAKDSKDAGDFFAWGETETKDSYTNYNYTYKDNPKVLPLANDAAHVQWGENWRMPTKEEFDELRTQCKWNSDVQYGTLSGYEVKSNKTGNSIYLPAAGTFVEQRFNNQEGWYWASTINGQDNSEAECLSIKPNSVESNLQSRTDGCTVRAVYDPNTICVYKDGAVICSYSRAEADSVSFIEELPADDKAVDLGLPSGTKWAAYNIGAESPTDLGDYFAWGEIDGYKNGKTKFEWGTYKHCMGYDNTLTKYCNNSNYGYLSFYDGKKELLDEDDAAAKNWGEGWQMPTKADFEELKTNCSWSWKTNYNGSGVNGYEVTGTNGKKIFLPAAGEYSDEVYYVGEYGYYWSKTLYTDNPNYACGLEIRSNRSSYYYYGYRFYGRSIRAVCK